MRYLAVLLLPYFSVALAEQPASAMYLANEGVMVTEGDTRILFDPLFRDSYGLYELLPQSMERALFAGEPPFDGIDAVFVSHYHGDHFSPGEMLDYLRQQAGVQLFAPAQAVRGLEDASDPADAEIFDRVTSLDLDYGETPEVFVAGDLLIEAFHIPHSGWPDSRREVQNLAFRVTLPAGTTVLHLGDADTRIEHFDRDGDQWARRRTGMAFPPYWYFQSERGRAALAKHVRPVDAVGIHVPASVPDDPATRPPEFAGQDLFTQPGETRAIAPGPAPAPSGR